VPDEKCQLLVPDAKIFGDQFLGFVLSFFPLYHGKSPRKPPFGMVNHQESTVWDGKSPRKPPFWDGKSPKKPFGMVHHHNHQESTIHLGW